MSGEAARVLAEADQSAWNGRIAESAAPILGLAHWDGTLYLDRESILDPLQHMYEHAGEERPTSTLVIYRESLATLLHEHAHFLGPFGSSQEAAREAFTKPGSRQLEEGVTEAWAQDHLDEYIHRLGIDKVAPGIDSVQASGYYAAFVPAVRELTSDLESRNDLRQGEVLDLLNRQTAASQMPLLVTLVYNSTRLPDLEPAGDNTRSRLESILRSGLEHLDNYELAPPDFATTNSLSTADQILNHLTQEIQSAEAAYPSTPPRAIAPPHADARTLPPPVPTRDVPSPHQTALSGLMPPTTTAPPAATHPSPARSNHSSGSRQALTRTA
ncbi:hypothetical protein [Kribbella kalugense]|uniref:Uncharacterized protein n=1 Tax=Kribbella kalugense TaxID=2512221 RepID=A0A4R7ZRM8_9ACTN|nr:hypothetical protein [Kribbella kalugense]TDW18070.1 hypothetical protein EV650_4651 [Kribbella kalugense]